jgi:uncharacterized repeat protein (TIGR03803 family)
MQTKFYAMSTLACLFLFCLAVTAGAEKDPRLTWSHNAEPYLPEDLTGRLVIPNVYLTLPANNDTAASINGRFRTKAVNGATLYTLELSLTPGFDSVVVMATSPTRDLQTEKLAYLTTYYARVKTDLAPEYGPVTSFRTRGPVDYAFVSRPAEGATGVEVVNVFVIANLVQGATHYTVELSKVPDFSDTVLTESSTFSGERAFGFDRLEYSTTYYSRVKTNLAAAYGRVTQFTTRAELFSTVTEPVDGTVDVDPTLMKVIVAPITGAERYTLEVSTEPDFSGSTRVRNSLEDGQRVFIFKDLAPSTTYYTRVRTDISTGFGAVTSFTTRALATAQRLWGLTTQGGAHGLGTVFSFSLDSLTLSKHHDYYHEYEARLNGSLIRTTSGKLHGVSIYEGTGGGEVFAVDADGNFELVDYASPHMGSVILGSNNYLYILDDWINLFRGGIYRIYADGDNVPILDRIIFRFSSDAQGLNPRAPLMEREDGYLYGTAPYGGTDHNGTLYRLRTDGSGFQVVHSFTGTDGTRPDAALADGGDGYVYGMTVYGGSADQGVLFKVQPDGSNFTKLFDFSGMNGQYPRGSLLMWNGSLYGMTSGGGASGAGIIFRIQPDGSGFTKLMEFSGANGAIPLGALIAGREGTFYGMTAGGGLHDLGVIFKIQPDGTGFTLLQHFSASTGGAPNGDLLLVDEINTVPLASAETSEASLVAEEPIAKVSAYPNPFENATTVEMQAAVTESVRMILTDLDGTVLHEQVSATNTPVQFGHQLRRGIYILKVIRGSEISVYRLVKK